MKTFTYTNVTPAEVLAVRAHLVAGGAAITTPAPDPGDAFHVEGHGIKADAVYDAATQTLTVTVVDKPWWMKISIIDSGIKEGLAKAA
jgi:hypothetical protein